MLDVRPTIDQCVEDVLPVLLHQIVDVPEDTTHLENRKKVVGLVVFVFVLSTTAQRLKV
jgi:hypothetical protein